MHLHKVLSRNSCGKLIKTLGLTSLGIWACLTLSSNTAFAQSPWPTRPITIIVPFPPGGATDVLARAVASRLGPVLGQPVIIDYKPGAGATLGAAIAAKAPADGYTLLMGAVHHTIAANVYKNLSYDFQKDFAPITVVGVLHNVLVVKMEMVFVGNSSSTASSISFSWNPCLILFAIAATSSEDQLHAGEFHSCRRLSVDW